MAQLDTETWDAPIENDLDLVQAEADIRTSSKSIKACKTQLF